MPPHNGVMEASRQSGHKSRRNLETLVTVRKRRRIDLCSVYITTVLSALPPPFPLLSDLRKRSRNKKVTGIVFDLSWLLSKH
jgi:hypothetical protein